MVTGLQGLTLRPSHQPYRAVATLTLTGDYVRAMGGATGVGQRGLKDQWLLQGHGELEGHDLL